ncbi:10328_t:CDS:2 [Acaulospora colombiana]|uniref:10328_t:CDS:1 n=1 Tax=Acaulospora colombiana TaxID=27376 RepID=A0ACA9JXF5_9GLOM|nr:10328_t:CDS:2 [Acaulospora colombiana]
MDGGKENEIHLAGEYEKPSTASSIGTIYSIEQREQEERAIKEDIDMIGQAMGELKNDMKSVIKELSILSSNVEQLSTQIRKSRTGIDVGSANSAIDSAVDMYQVQRIEYSDLKDPEDTKDIVRGDHKKIVKKSWRGLEVACKRIHSIEKNDTPLYQKTRTELAILTLLGQCNYIIYFHGLSRVDSQDVMVFEWAKEGNLKYFYENFFLDSKMQLKLARDIFSGLYFIHNSNILHHDVRCENILITEDKVAKITNFELARNVEEASRPVRNLSTYVRWLAPEKMNGNRYTHQCEMFRNYMKNMYPRALRHKSFAKNTQMKNFRALVWVHRICLMSTTV